jgi:Fe-S-cluster-containing hydrogenase component 2
MPLLGLSELMEVLDRLQGHAVQVQAQQCTRARHRKSTCTRCADACPTGAISWDDGLTVDPEKCTGCGACTAVCPTGALEAHSPSDAELLARARQVAQEKKTVAFACPRYLEGADGAKAACVSVQCLGRLDEAVLVGAVAAGATSVLLLDGACADCPSAKARDVAQAMVARSNRLLEAFGVPPRISIGAQLPSSLLAEVGETAEAMSRRGFFTLLARETMRLGAVTADTVIASHKPEEKEERHIGELPAVVPAKRLLLLEELKCLGEPKVGRVEVEGWAEFGYVEKCTGCQMCGFFCPTGALQKADAEGKVGVRFQASLCTDCDLCADTCYQNAMEMVKGADLKKVLEDTVEEFWMREAEAEPWKGSRDGRMARSIIDSLGL